MWLEIQSSCVPTKDALNIFKKPETSALRSLAEGHMAVFKGIMAFLERHEAWDDIFTSCQEIFRKGLKFHAIEKSARENSGTNMLAAHQAAEAKSDDITNSIMAPSESEAGLKQTKAAKDAKKDGGSKVERIGKDIRAVKTQESTEATTSTEINAFSTTVLDWSVWKQFINAAKHNPDPRK